MTQPDFLQSVFSCFDECEPTRKVERTRAAAISFFAGEAPLDPWRALPLLVGVPADPTIGLAVGLLAGPNASRNLGFDQAWIARHGDGRDDRLDQPGRPTRPELVAPRLLSKRGLKEVAGRAALIHAVAHIEFNAINLALDAMLRFPGMPWDYYADWMRVADEEAYHFSLMRERLRELGYDYGDLPAHDGLWEMARQTAGDLLERMALVPRVLEARGLDVTPGMIERLRSVGDHDTADRLGIILHEEVGHVAIGSRWFRWLCEQRDLDSRETYLSLIREQFMNRGRRRVPCPLNLPDRRRAGFDEAELDGLMALCGGSKG